VTERIPPLKIRGRTYHQIGLPYHWGSIGLSKGDPASELIAFVADPNVSIQESKVFTGNIEPGRRSRQRRAATSGPLAKPAAPEERGDLDVVRDKPQGEHGLWAGERKQTEQS
jgi:formate dehydrogenase major subunit